MQLDDMAMDLWKNKYLGKGETIEDRINKVTTLFCQNRPHKQRMFNYIMEKKFLPATPIINSKCVVPISCFTNSVEDSLEGIQDNYSSNYFKSAYGGGIASYWGNVRSAGEPISNGGVSSGIMPFLKVQDAYIGAIIQGSIRRGAGAAYLNVDHPEIFEFIDIRKSHGKDANLSCVNLHHAVCLTDEFMQSVETDGETQLKNIVDKKVVRTVKSREIWEKILSTRMETGEPYLFFTDTVNKHSPYAKLDKTPDKQYPVDTSNLCTEITMATGKLYDKDSYNRIGVCCLGSINLEQGIELVNDDRFLADITLFLDGVITQTFLYARANKHFKDLIFSLIQERSIGIGVMGFAGLLMKKQIPFEYDAAKDINLHIFKNLRNNLDRINRNHAKIYGGCKLNSNLRHLHMTAVAPTVSISQLLGATQGVEPIYSNAFYKKYSLGGRVVWNNFLLETLKDTFPDAEIDVIKTLILKDGGSVQNINYLTSLEKRIFKTAFEINQLDIINLASDRANLIDQSQSINLYFRNGTSKKEIHKVHFDAWKKGLKTLYYCRSEAPVSSSDSLKSVHGIKCFGCD